MGRRLACEVTNRAQYGSDEHRGDDGDCEDPRESQALVFGHCEREMVRRE